MKKKRKFSKSLHIPLLLLLVSLALVYASIDYFNKDDFIKVDTLLVDGNLVAVGNGCKAIVAGVTQERAQMIQLGIDGQLEPRPNIYDIFKNTLEFYEIEFEELRISNLQGNSYHAVSSFKKGNEVLNMDSRPSDAIALALRTNTTVYLNKTILDQQGQDIC